MKKGFVQTENFKRLTEAKKLVERRGAREAGLVIIKGVYGVGKTELTSRWAAESNWVFVRAKATWTKRAMLDELADAMGLIKNGRNQEVQARIIAKMALDDVPMIIDEADHLISKSSASLLEVLRDVTDLTGTMCFLVGMESFVRNISRHGHIASRVAKVVEFQPLSINDVLATIAKKAEVEMDKDVAALIHLQAKGRMRLVINAIANVEHWAGLNGWGKVTLDHVKDKELCAEWDSKRLGRTRESI
jgi:DNA transposition AAA+ family ATPase